MRRLNQEQLSELQRLHSEGTALLGWLEEREGFSHGGAIRSILDEAITKRELGKMRAVAQELRGLLASLPPALRHKILEGIGTSGMSLAADLEIDADAARAIVARGRIASEGEYYVLRRYLDRLEADTATSDGERHQVQAMLENYGGGSAPAAT